MFIFFFSVIYYILTIKTIISFTTNANRRTTKVRNARGAAERGGGGGEF
tara:strand:- start:472 stop:618 length:147 start_codon:yes stop_codon:yes gene_type:complete